MRRRIIVALLAVSVLVATPPALGQTFQALDDASGNGNDLTEVGTIETVDGPVPKFGDGQRLDSTDDGATTSSPDFDVVTQDASFLIAASNLTGGENPQISVQNTANDGFYTLEISNTDVAFEYDADDGTVKICEDTFGGTTHRNVTAWARINPGGALTDTVVELRAFAGGNEQALNTCAFAPEPASGTFEAFNLTTDFMNDHVDVTEIRAWDTLVDTDTLDAIADPNDPSFQFEAEGTEIGLYFLEPITLGQVTTPLEGHLHVHTDPSIVEGAGLVVDAYVTNATGVTVSPAGNLTLFVTRVTGADGIQFWNETASAWQSTDEGVGVVMTETTTDRNLFETTLNPTGTGTWHPYVTGALETTDTPTETANLTGSANVEVLGADVPIEIAGMDSSQLIHLAVTGLFFLIAAWEGWVFPMVAGLMGTPAPIFASEGIAYPIGFQAFIFLALMAIVLQVAAARFGKLGDGQGQTVGTR